MKAAIISDQHLGARKNSKIFHDYFQLFYENVFFPTLEQYGITTVVDMGDTFDNRKSIDFSALLWAKTNYYDKLHQLGIEVHTIVGNHTAYYKNSNQVNSVELLLREYDNIKTYSDPKEILLDKLNVLLIPWICSENYEKTLKIIQRTKAKVLMGHLELKGFKVNKNMVMDDGLDSNIFSKFDKVFSGHFHTRSSNGNVSYLGNPYEMFWGDVNDTRGFHIFDTETYELTPINNPYRLFYNLYYEDTCPKTVDFSEYENKLVRVIVRQKKSQKNFEKFIDKLYSSNIQDLKIIENFENQTIELSEDIESEDTLSILDKFIQETEIDIDKNKIQGLIHEIYKEACELV